jgi:hypothetical protein
VKVDENLRKALGPKARKGIYVGHNDTSSCARIMRLDKTKLNLHQLIPLRCE